MLTSPYITTYLPTTVALDPRSMQTNIYKQIKDIVVQKHLGRCYKSYGFVSNIFKLDEASISGGYIRTEDASSSAIYNVKFLCRLCNPLRATTIVATIVGIHKLMIYAQNGPINIIIKSTAISNKIYYSNEKNTYMVKINSTHSREIQIGSFVAVRIDDRRIVNNEKTILVMGYLTDIATEDDWKKNRSDEYNPNTTDIVEVSEDTTHRTSHSTEL